MNVTENKYVCSFHNAMQNICGVKYQKTGKTSKFKTFESRLDQNNKNCSFPLYRRN